MPTHTWCYRGSPGSASRRRPQGHPYSLVLEQSTIALRPLVVARLVRAWCSCLTRTPSCPDGRDCASRDSRLAACIVRDNVVLDTQYEWHGMVATGVKGLRAPRGSENLRPRCQRLSRGAQRSPTAASTEPQWEFGDRFASRTQRSEIDRDGAPDAASGTPSVRRFSRSWRLCCRSRHGREPDRTRGQLTPRPGARCCQTPSTLTC